MAIVPLHRSITKETLQEYGFSEEAAELAARANAAVDEKQGSDAGETNLHAMAGRVADSISGNPGGRLQDKDETMRRVEERLSTLRTSITAKIRSKNFSEALQELGEALHTVQDRAFHNFEAWPYDGIGAAIRDDPNYMFAHAIRDLGGVNRLDIRTGEGVLRYRAEWTFQLGSNSYLSVGGFCEQGATNARAARTPGSLGSDNGFRGSGGFLTFTLGAAPGSIPAPPRAGDLSQGIDRSSLESILTQGPAARATARDASRAFVGEIKRQVVRQAGPGYWNFFLGFRGQ